MAKRAKSKKAKDDRAHLMGQRLAFSRVRLDEIINKGDAYRPFIEGDAPETHRTDEDTTVDDESSRRREERAMGKGWRKTSVPAHGVLRQVLLPSLVSRPPTWVNRENPKPRYEELTPEEQKECEIQRRRGKVYTALAEKIYREFKVHHELTSAVDDAMSYGVGWLETDFDNERGLPRIRWQSSERVMVDMESDDDPFGKNHRWRAVAWAMSKADAEKKAKDWGVPKYEFSPEKMALDDFGTTDRTLSKAEETPTEYVKLVRIYVSGNSPHLDSANLGSDGKVEEVGEDDVYDGHDRVIIMECCGRWDSWDNYKYITEFDWPFPVDHDDFPLEPVRITQTNRSFYPYPIYQPGHSLQIALNWAMRYYNTDAYRSSRRFIGYVASAFDKKTLEAALHGVDNLATVPFKSQGDMERAIKAIDFGQPNPALEKTIAGNQSQYDKSTGLDAFNLEARSHRTATDAAIQNEEAQLRVGAMADKVEEALTNAMRKALMCARKLMTAEEVADWLGAGSESLLMMEDRLDEKGNVVRYSPVWDDRVSDTAAIRKEVDINLEQRSVRFVSPEQELNDLDRLGVKQMELLRAVTEANQMNPQLAAAMASAGNALIKAYAERLHLPDSSKYLIDLNAALTQPLPQTPAGGPGGTATPSGGPGSPPAGPSEGGQVAAQLGGTMEDLGLSPANLPGGLADRVVRAGE